MRGRLLCGKQLDSKTLFVHVSLINFGSLLFCKLFCLVQSKCDKGIEHFVERDPTIGIFLVIACFQSLLLALRLACNSGIGLDFLRLKSGFFWSSYGTSRLCELPFDLKCYARSVLFSAELKPPGYYLELFWQAIIGVKVPNSSHVASIQH